MQNNDEAEVEVEEKENKTMELRTKEINAKDMFNASTSAALKELGDEPIKVTGLWVKAREDEDGKVKEVAYLKREDGEIFATVSSTIIEQLEALAEMLEEGPCEVKVITRKSNAGREFMQLMLV